MVDKPGHIPFVMSQVAPIPFPAIVSCICPLSSLQTRQRKEDKNSKTRSQEDEANVANDELASWRTGTTAVNRGLNLSAALRLSRMQSNGYLENGCNMGWTIKLE